MATNSIQTSTINLGSKEIILETGRFAPQTAGTVTARCGDTIVIASVVTAGPKEGLDFFPLTVEYREKHYAGGVISSSRFVKREGKPSDNEILTSRLIDRSIRPFFPKGFKNEVQVIVSPLSIDGVHEPEVLGIIAASAALSISDIPFDGPVGAIRVGHYGGLIANPTLDEKLNSDLDLVISGTPTSIAMVEAGANEVQESLVLDALKFGQDQIGLIVSAIDKLKGKEKQAFIAPEYDPTIVDLVNKKIDINEVLKQSKTVSGEGIKLAPLVELVAGDDLEIDRIQIAELIDNKLKTRIRELILDEGIRFDDRKATDIRDITAEVGLLPRTHGSGYFKRGLTHVLSVATLGSPADEQLIEGMKGEETKRYMHHYNMTPVATGEPGRFGAPGRREIGHGALAERALIPVLPSVEEFPYTVRVVSEVMSSNGSTSQASVCGSTLALMDAGVPIKKPVAGIAMGLITDGKKAVTLSDIAGLEDHFGDMDFKVAGTNDGVTAIQMDVKVQGITAQILGSALEQAKVGRLFILEKMAEAITAPREKISEYAPRILSLQIDPDKIGTVIGPGGKTIRPIQDDLGVEISIEDTGLVSITGTNSANVEKAKQMIEALTAEVEVGKIYEGKVVRLQPFGAFVEILPGKDGLVHVSNMSKDYVSDPKEVVKEGDKVQVKVFEIDNQGRVNLTMNLEDNPGSRERKPSDRPQRSQARRDNRGPKRDFNRFTDKR